jgi:hypothetical protein
MSGNEGRSMLRSPSSETPGRGIHGFLLNLSNDGTFVFRVYDPRDKRNYKDYKLRVDNLEIEICSDYYSLFEDEAHDPPLRVDYASRRRQVQ